MSEISELGTRHVSQQSLTAGMTVTTRRTKHRTTSSDNRQNTGQEAQITDTQQPFSILATSQMVSKKTHGWNRLF